MRIRTVFAVAVVTLVLGCFGAGRHTSPEKLTLLYGALRVPNGFSHLRLQRQFSPMQEAAWIDAEGNFAFIDLPPGKYILAGFYKDGRFFSLHTMKEPFIFDLAQGEAKYAGAYEVTDFSLGAFGPGSFNIERRDQIASTDVLRALWPQLEKTQWAARLEGQSAAQATESVR